MRAQIRYALDSTDHSKGVAFAHTTSDMISLNDIRTVSNWGEKMSNWNKIPSKISYTPKENGEAQWGANLSPNAIAMIKMKLELDLGEPSDELDLIQLTLEGIHHLDFNYIERGGADYTWKTPEEIVEDYLRKVFNCAESALERFTTAFRNLTTTDIVITMPPVGYSLLRI